MASPDRVLIVDDDPEMCELLTHCLAPLGYDATSVGNGHRALELVETEPLHVVVLDLMLPDLDGIEVLERIRERRPKIEVIVLTAHASLDTAIEALRQGAYDYVTKPFGVDVIRSTVRRAMEKRRLGARLDAIYDLSREMALALDVEQVVGAVLDIVERVLEFETCSLELVDEERGELYSLAMRGMEWKVAPRLPLSSAKGIVIAVARDGEPLYVPDVREDPRYMEASAATRSELAVPLKVKRGVVGVLNVESAQVDAFSQDDVRLLSTLAAQAAVAIENARLYEQAQREIAERKRAEEKLRESEQRLKIKLDHILSPDQEIGDFKLTDIADVETLQQIQDAFAQANSVASIILDLDGNPITEESNYCELCHLIRQTVKGKTNCEQSGIVLGAKVAETLEPAWHACQSCGLLEACAPIVVAGKHIANWFIGQSNTLGASRERIRDYAEEIGADANAMLAAFNKMPEMPIEKFERILTLLWQVALELSTSAYNNLKLAREVSTRKQAEEELGRRNRHLLVLQAVAATVGRSLDLDEILRAALDEVLEVMGLEVGGIQLLDESGERLLLEAHRGISETFCRAIAEVRVADDPPARQIIASGQPLIVSERKEVEEQFEAEADAEGLGSCVQFPLRSAGRVLGLMTVQSRGQREFSADEVALLTAIGDTVGVAIENARMFQASQWRAAELQALYDTSLRLSTHPEPSELLRLIVEQAVALLGAEAGGFYLYDPRRDELTFLVTVGYFTEFVGTTLEPGEGLAGKALASRRSLVVEDYYAWPERAAIYEGESRFRATLAVPLLGAEGVLGVLDIGGGEQKRAFDERDVWLAELFAAQAAVALEHARLHEEERRRAVELAALNKACRAMASTLDLDEVLTQVMAEARAMLDAEAASVLLHDPADDELVFAASVGPASETLVGTRMPATEGVAGWVMQEAQPVLVRDAQDDPRFYDRIDTATGLTTRPLLAVPLKHKERVIGVLEAINRAGGVFDEHDLDLLSTLASSAAIAIENARLYEAEREQHRLVEQSRAQLVQSEKLAATGRLAASMAHEINNPLQAIHNSLQLVLGFALEPGERQEYLQMADEEVQRLMGLVKRILDFARRPQREMRPTNLNDVVEKVLALANKYLQHRHIALRRDLSPDLPAVIATADELGQVFLNLVLNSVDAMPEGGTLRVSSRLAQDGHLTVAFSDTGAGISPEHLDRIFEPFFSTREKGTGIGLAISHNIIERHGGEITVQSVMGEGTTFTVHLPAM